MIKFKRVLLRLVYSFVYSWVRGCVEKEERMEVNGRTVYRHDKKVPIRRLSGGAEGFTVPKGILNVLRQRRFLDISVVLTDEGKYLMVIETSSKEE